MNANELDKWIDNSPYTEAEEVIRLLRQLQKERDLLFSAHSHEMVRADELAVENEALKKRLDDMAGELMSLENQIGTITGYGHN
jgi:dynactin complex subunit